MAKSSPRSGEENAGYAKPCPRSSLDFCKVGIPSLRFSLHFCQVCNEANQILFGFLQGVQ